MAQLVDEVWDLRRSGRPSQIILDQSEAAARALIRGDAGRHLLRMRLISTTTAPATSPCRFASRSVSRATRGHRPFAGIAEQVKRADQFWLVRCGQSTARVARSNI